MNTALGLVTLFKNTVENLSDEEVLVLYDLLVKNYLLEVVRDEIEYREIGIVR
jgi:hypothetical protein